MVFDRTIAPLLDAEHILYLIENFAIKYHICSTLNSGAINVS